MLIEVREGNLEQACKYLKKLLQREGFFRELKLRMFHEKPSVKKARRQSESIRRHRKLERKRKQREYL